MPNESFPVAIDATSAPARVPLFAFPEPLAPCSVRRAWRARGQGGQSSQSQAYFVCGNGPCASSYGAAFGRTPIDDIKLGGGYWDVTWSLTPPPTSPFVLSEKTSDSEFASPMPTTDAGDFEVDWDMDLFYGYGGGGC